MTDILTLPKFGIYVPGQGGYFAAIMRGHSADGIEQPPYALLVADASTETMAEWGKYGQDVPGTSSRHDGKANTDAMPLADCPAALAVRKLTIDGHNDFYLPALGELNSAAANVPELFSTDDCYWTSTQDSRRSAVVQDFEYGYSYWDFKGNRHRVRAFRRVGRGGLW